MMTNLQRAALGRLPLTEATVASFYDGTHAGSAAQCLKALCESHERLRAELEGMEVILADAEREVDRLKARLAAALALTDTGSPAYLAAFPPRTPDEASEAAPGWRVVEQIRTTLLDQE